MGPTLRAFALFILLYSNSSFAKITMRWFGVSGFILSDQKTTIVFDPALTTVGLMDYLPWVKVDSDPEVVDYWMERCELKEIDALFINHTHSDHAIDLVTVMKKWGGVVYGSRSAQMIALGGGIKKERTHIIKNHDEVQVGDFAIKAFTVPHNPHLMGITLMDGEIEEPLKTPTSAWNYQLGGHSYNFSITHPEGNILFQSTNDVKEKDPMEGLKARTIIMTISNRPSSENLINKRVLPSKAEEVIPVHHDNFFLPLKRDGGIHELWGVKTEEFSEKMKSLAPHVKLSWPSYCDEKILF